MDIYEYMWNVAMFVPTELGRFEKLLLQVMTSCGTPVSTYEIWKNYGFHNIAYKNVHKRVRRLQQLGIIESTIERPDRTADKPNRGAKYYRVSLFGFIQTMKSCYLHFPKDLIKNYKDNILVKTFLYQFFDEDTIAWATPRLECEIHDYLRRCCIMTYDACDFASSKGHYIASSSSMNKSNLKLNSQNNSKSIGNQIERCEDMINFMGRDQVMKTNFGIREESIVKRFKEHLNRIRKKISVIEQSGDLEPCSDFLMRLESMIHFQMAHLKADLEWNVKAMAIRLVSGNDFSKALIERDLLNDDTYSRTNELLRSDKKFSNLLQSIKNELDYGFKLMP